MVIALLGLVVTLLGALLTVNMGVFFRIGSLTATVEAHAERIEHLEKSHG